MDAPIKHVPFVASYNRDFQWLRCLLKSLLRHGDGWAAPVVCTDRKDAAGAAVIAAQEFPGSSVVVLDPKPNGCGYLRAQCAMMSCDLLADGDYFWLFGSDTVLTARLSPLDLWSHDYARPVMPYTPHSSLGRITEHWKRGVEAALGFEPENEFMRRLPLPYPRTLYPRVREALQQRHGMEWDSYVYSTAAGRNGYQSTFSESNVLGAYAWQHMHSIYAWVNTDEFNPYQPPLYQFWSHGGFSHVDPRTGKTQGQMLVDMGLWNGQSV